MRFLLVKWSASVFDLGLMALARFENFISKNRRYMKLTKLNSTPALRLELNHFFVSGNELTASCGICHMADDLDSI